MDNVEDRTPKGAYANHFHVGYNAFEFILDFGFASPEEPEPKMHTRIITSPMLVGAFAGLLEQSLREYEAEHQIQLPRPPIPPEVPPEKS